MFQEDMQQQFTLERTNEQFYRALSSAAEMVNWPGAQKFFYDSANDEQGHALRIRDYLIARNVKPIFEPLEAIPNIDGENYVGMFELALQREKMTTDSINEKYQNAVDEPDPQTVVLLVSGQGDWPGFIQEQTDSEKELFDMITMIRRLSPDGLIKFDSDLG